MNKFFSRGIAAIANLFAPAFGRTRIDYSELAEKDDSDGIGELIRKGPDSTQLRDHKRNPAGTKLARKAAAGRLGMATLR